jgi:hypothetical protein
MQALFVPLENTVENIIWNLGLVSENFNGS